MYFNTVINLVYSTCFIYFLYYNKFFSPHFEDRFGEGVATQKSSGNTVLKESLRRRKQTVQKTPDCHLTRHSRSLYQHSRYRVPARGMKRRGTKRVEISFPREVDFSPGPWTRTGEERSQTSGRRKEAAPLSPVRSSFRRIETSMNLRFPVAGPKRGREKGHSGHGRL